MFFNTHTHLSSTPANEIYNATLDEPITSYFSIGIHPWNATLAEIDTVREKAKTLNCLAIGEVGLDKLKGPDLECQKRCFIEQIKLSEELQLPLIIHCVKAWNELQAIKREMKPKQYWIYHGFTKANLMSEVLKEDLLISIGEAILSNKKLQKEIVNLPVNQLLLETDDSSISIQHIYQKISALKNIPLPELENQIEDNFKRVFTKWKTG